MAASTVTSADRLVFVDRLMAVNWLKGTVKTFDKLACSTLDIVEASWEVLKEPVTEVMDTFVYSTSAGQFTIGCLETGVDITANVLDKVLNVFPPVGENEKVIVSEESVDKEPIEDNSATPEIGGIEKKRKTRPLYLLQPIQTVSTSLVHVLRSVQWWLHSMKLESYDDICGHCSKRRKVIAQRRLGPLHSLMHITFSAVTAPLDLVGLHLGSDVLRCAVTVSGNECIDKSPVRPKSAIEKRKYPELSSSDEERHTFHDDLGDYKSAEDEDYEPEKEETSDSDEYAEGETESDVSVGKTLSPLKPRKSKKVAKASKARVHTPVTKKNRDKKMDDASDKKATSSSTGTEKNAEVNGEHDGSVKDASSVAEKAPNIANANTDSKKDAAQVNGEPDGSDKGAVDSAEKNTSVTDTDSKKSTAFRKEDLNASNKKGSAEKNKTGKKSTDLKKVTSPTKGQIFGTEKSKGFFK